MYLNPAVDVAIQTEKALAIRIEPKRVLIVDDDHTILTIVSRMVKILGFSVDLANCEIVAKQCLSESTYDIIITDLQMSDLAGWLKYKSKNTAMIIMTGRSRSDVTKYKNYGNVDNWIFKPFTFNEMADALHTYL